MNRRGFLGAIGAALAGAVIDPELALWVPGRKIISIPKPSIRVVWPPDGELFMTTEVITLAEFKRRYSFIPRIDKYPWEMAAD